MKKSILSLEGVIKLSKNQQKNIFGGLYLSQSFSDASACAETPSNKCSSDSDCTAKKSNSYCYTHSCESNGNTVSYKSCQFVRD
jgi:hypothetical protein